jgi:uncharacterized protein YgiB involved in biofilm formation
MDGVCDWSSGLLCHVDQKMSDTPEKISWMPASAGFLLGLLLDPDNEANMFCQNAAYSS